MATAPDAQPMGSLSHRVTTAPNNDMTIEIVNDTAPGGIEQNTISVGRPSEDH